MAIIIITIFSWLLHPGNPRAIPGIANLRSGFRRRADIRYDRSRRSYRTCCCRCDRTFDSARIRQHLQQRRHTLRHKKNPTVTSSHRHAYPNRHPSTMRAADNPYCYHCQVETAAHFVGECDRYASLRREIWAKPYLHPDDFQHVIEGDLVSFIRKSRRFP